MIAGTKKMFGWDRLRYMAVEDLGWDGAERVAIGGLSRRDGQMHWRDLTNVSDSPEHNFAVDGEEVSVVLAEMVKQGVNPAILWHSHESVEGPSAKDLRELPEWLQVGVVWSSTSGVSTAYDKTGVISSINTHPDTSVGIVDKDEVIEALEEATQEMMKAGVLDEGTAREAAHVALQLLDSNEE